MPAQSRVTAANEHELLPCLPCLCRHPCRNRTVLFLRLRRLERTRVREDKEHPVFLGKSCGDALLRPVRVDVDAVHRLHARRIVVKHDDLAVKGLTFLVERGVDLRLVNRGNFCKQLVLRYLHDRPPYGSSDFTTTPEMLS